MSTNKRNVKGYIFLSSGTGRYYLEPGKGQVYNKQDAHVYSCEEAKEQFAKCTGWGGKKEGKWIVVYE